MASAWITAHPSSAVLCPTASSFPRSRTPDGPTPGHQPREAEPGSKAQAPRSARKCLLPAPGDPAPPCPTGRSARAAEGLHRAPRAFRPRRAWRGGRRGERDGGGRAVRFASPCVRARQTEPGAAAAATTRRPPPRQERPAAASSSALPQAGRRPTDSSAAAADSHPPGTDRRTGPGPSRCLRRRHRPLRAAPAPRPPSLFL